MYSKTKEEIFIYNFAGPMLRKETLKAGDNKIDISHISKWCLYFAKRE